MKKKGEELSLLALLVTIASAVVFGFLVYKGYSYGSQHEFYKIAVARDLALTIDTAYSLPGDISYVYPNDVLGYDIEIKDNLVKIYDHKSKILADTYRFAGIAGHKLDTFIENAKYIKLEKKGDEIKISGVGQ